MIDKMLGGTVSVLGLNVLLLVQNLVTRTKIAADGIRSHKTEKYYFWSLGQGGSRRMKLTLAGYAGPSTEHRVAVELELNASCSEDATSQVGVLGQRRAQRGFTVLLEERKLEIMAKPNVETCIKEATKRQFGSSQEYNAGPAQWGSVGGQAGSRRLPGVFRQAYNKHIHKLTERVLLL